MVVRAGDLRNAGWLATVGVGALVATTFLPWLDINGAEQTSYEVVGDAENLGLLEGWGGASMAMLWYAVPALALAVLIFQFIGRWALGGMLAMLVGVVGIVGAVVILRNTQYDPGVGPLVTLVTGAIVTVLGARVDLFRTDVNKIQPW